MRLGSYMEGMKSKGLWGSECTAGSFHVNAVTGSRSRKTTNKSKWNVALYSLSLSMIERSLFVFVVHCAHEYLSACSVLFFLISQCLLRPHPNSVDRSAPVFLCLAGGSRLAALRHDVDRPVLFAVSA